MKTHIFKNHKLTYFQKINQAVLFSHLLRASLPAGDAGQKTITTQSWSQASAEGRLQCSFQWWRCEEKEIKLVGAKIFQVKSRKEMS